MDVGCLEVLKELLKSVFFKLMMIGLQKPLFLLFENS